MSKANFSRAEITERVDFSDDLWLIKVKPESEFTFKPGQYATLAVEAGEKLIQRPYSVVSSPHEPFLEFFFELVPHGELTPRLYELKVGDHLLVRNRIVGAFVLHDKTGMKNHLMGGTVTGTVPYISMARAQAEEIKKGRTDVHQMAILMGASRSWEMGVYKDELTRIAQDGWLQFIPTVSRPWEDPDWKGEVGRVEDIIRKYGDQLGFTATNSVGYACGHPQMIENVKGILARAGFPKENIREEKFFTIKEEK
jgi:ferredoxin--NADP+ reductase